MLTPEIREDLKRALRLSGLMLAAACLVAGSLVTNQVGGSLGGVTVLILAAMLAAVAASAVLAAGELRLPGTPLLPAIVLAFAVVTVTGLFAAHSSAAGDHLEAWVVYAVVGVSVAALAARRCECRFVLAVVLATASVIAAYGVFQRYVGLAALRTEFAGNPEAFEQIRHAFGATRRLASNRVYGNFVLPNSLAGYLGLVLPLSVAMCAAAVRERGSRRWPVLIALGGTVALSLWCLVLTGSKGGAAAAAAGMAVFFAAKRWSGVRRRPGAAMAAAVAAGALGILLVTAMPESTPGLGGAKLSMSVRVNYWRAAGGMMRDHPLGVGPGGFGDSYTRYKVPGGWEARHPHNIYLNWGAELGILGLAALIVLLAALARSVPGSSGSAGGGGENGGQAPPAFADAGDGEPYERKLRSFGLLAGVAAFAIMYAGPGVLDSASIGELFLGFTGETLAIPEGAEADARIASQRCVLRSAAGGIEAGTPLGTPQIARLRAEGVDAVPVNDPDKRSAGTAFTALVHLLFPVLWCAVFLAAYAHRLGREWWAAALAGGFAAFAAHGLVDLDDTVPGIMLTLIAMGSAGAAARADSLESPVRITGLRGSRGMGAAAAAAALLALFVVVRVYPSVVAAQAAAFAAPVIRLGPASDLVKAIEDLDGAVHLRPEDDRLQMMRYMAYRKIAPMAPPSEAARLEAEATRIAQLRTELNPASHIPREQLGHRLMVIGDYPGAAAAYGEAAERYPLRPLEWFYLGDARLLSGERSAAVASYLRGAAVDRTITDERCVLLSVPFFRYFALRRSADVEEKLGEALDDLLAGGDLPADARRAAVIRRAILHVTEYHSAAGAPGMTAVLERGRALGAAAELLEGLAGLEADPQAMFILGAVYSAAALDPASPERRRAAELWVKAGEANPSAPAQVRVRPEVAAEHARRGAWMRERAASAPRGPDG